MKYLIVNVYDSCYGFSVCSNGSVYDKQEIYKCPRVVEQLSREIMKLYLFQEERNVKESILNHYGDKYDIIVYCEDGETEVLKK